MLENVLNKIVDLVIDLKAIESSDNYEEMLQHLGMDNKLYKELYDIREKEKNKTLYKKDDYMFYIMTRSYYCNKLENEIMTLLKGNI